MKVLKYVLFSILGLVALFFVIGLFSSSVSYGHKITVDKPLKEAWGVSQDLTKYDQWLEGFESMELISGEYGEVGSKYKVVVYPGEGEDRFEMIETIVSIEDFDHVKMDFESEFMDFKQTINFEEENGKTTIATDSKVMAKNIMMRAMFAVMETVAGAFTAQEAKNMEALKVLIEENTTDYYPKPKAVETEMSMSAEVTQ